jgi:glyoxylase-like metal-dependent hydrolase (beta-lactamase superfamily II)
MRIERVLAPNPGPFTGPGTNTWLLDGDGVVLVIDPGPQDAGHASAIVERVGERKVTAVLVTHTHEDHAPLANPLASDLEVPAYGYAPGPGFDPDLRLTDGATVSVGDMEVRVVHTPGHSEDHLCFLAERVLFTGDHIMGGSSVMVDKMVPYLRSLERVRRLDLESLYPGHGEVVDDPQAVIDWYLAHRRKREGQIIEAITQGAASVADIVEAVYRDVDPSLHPLAARSVAAHVEKLVTEGAVVREGDQVILAGESTP